MRYTRIVLAAAASVTAVLTAAACGGAGGASREDAVAAAFYPLAFAAEEVAPGTEVVNLTPPGVEPHDLELDASDVETIDRAALVVFLGGGFQPAIEDAVGQRTGSTLDALEGQALLPGPGDEAGEGDPHVWLDPTRLAGVAREIASALGEPTAADDLAKRLEALDEELREGLATCERREIVTSHAAFAYLAERYGLEQVPLAGLAPEVEPSPRDVEELVRKVEETGATTVFFETLASPDLAETVAREAGATTAVLDPLEGIDADRLAAGDDYFTVMRENLAALREALGCR